jgi:2'-deoxynucleoside 5'-phosphate N-hydrolase
MNCYFTASIVGKKYYLLNYNKIVECVKKFGIKIQAEHILDTSENEIRLESREKRIAFHKQLEKWIKLSDFMIAEVSFPSISVGYEISLAMQMDKPVLILYSDKPPSLLAHHEDEKLVCEKYTNETVGGIIKDFVGFIDDKTRSRFTFFVTPEIASFLEKVQKKQKIPKSVYLGQLIEREMEDSKGVK